MVIFLLACVLEQGFDRFFMIRSIRGLFLPKGYPKYFPKEFSILFFLSKNQSRKVYNDYRLITNFGRESTFSEFVFSHRKDLKSVADFLSFRYGVQGSKAGNLSRFFAILLIIESLKCGGRSWVFINVSGKWGYVGAKMG